MFLFFLFSESAEIQAFYSTSICSSSFFVFYFSYRNWKLLDFSSYKGRSKYFLKAASQLMTIQTILSFICYCITNKLRAFQFASFPKPPNMISGNCSKNVSRLEALPARRDPTSQATLYIKYHNVRRRVVSRFSNRFAVELPVGVKYTQQASLSIIETAIHYHTMIVIISRALCAVTDIKSFVEIHR